ncbi:hypothetical protein KUTeg_000336 [Tegillarca granosa]|uniref:B box-type domain-containing protein n=1 Tax=Tegillarca granosa TaxID=220873 RepID=A0ABQ9G015_TEGGR|nr:hypothetical protein KUTeg_000336 [Tegillarca granosa]
MAAKTPIFSFQVAIEKCELYQEEDAQFYCNDFQGDMCSGCKTAHLGSNVSRSHNVVSNKLEIMRMYCTSCDEAVCVKCATDMKHEKHNSRCILKIFVSLMLYKDFTQLVVLVEMTL